MNPTTWPLVTLVLFMGSTAVGAEDHTASNSHQEKPPVMMAAYKVDFSYTPKLSFGLSLDVWKDNNTQKVTSIVITDIRSGSDAETKGLVPRTRIYRIDGKPVEEFTASFFKGTELSHLFVDRNNGAEIALEVWLPGAPTSKQVTVMELRDMVPSAARVWEKIKNP